MEFLGEKIDYWIELQRTATENNFDRNLLREIVELRGKLNFYETRLKQMLTAMEEETKC